jgi:hypothetical protein
MSDRSALTGLQTCRCHLLSSLTRLGEVFSPGHGMDGILAIPLRWPRLNEVSKWLHPAIPSFVNLKTPTKNQTPKIQYP